MDTTAKRRNIASRAVTAATQLVDALHTLQNLAEERAATDNFLDSDFTGTALAQLDAYTIGSLFDFVIPSLTANYTDAANGGRNKSVLLKVRS